MQINGIYASRCLIGRDVLLVLEQIPVTVFRTESTLKRM